jgi:hypothetical protein
VLQNQSTAPHNNSRHLQQETKTGTSKSHSQALDKQNAAPTQLHGWQAKLEQKQLNEIETGAVCFNEILTQSAKIKAGQQDQTRRTLSWRPGKEIGPRGNEKPNLGARTTKTRWGNEIDKHKGLIELCCAGVWPRHGGKEKSPVAVIGWRALVAGPGRGPRHEREDENVVARLSGKPRAKICVARKPSSVTVEAFARERTRARAQNWVGTRKILWRQNKTGRKETGKPKPLTGNESSRCKNRAGQEICHAWENTILELELGKKTKNGSGDRWQEQSEQLLHNRADMHGAR